MGRLINETDLMNLLCALDDARHDLCYAIKKIAELPTVDAIPKDQYEARLKADIVAMLSEILLEIEETEVDVDYAQLYYCKIIQEKINALKGE